MLGVRVIKKVIAMCTGWRHTFFVCLWRLSWRELSCLYTKFRCDFFSGRLFFFLRLFETHEMDGRFQLCAEEGDLAQTSVCEESVVF